MRQMQVAFGLHIMRLLPYSNTSAERDLGLLIADTSDGIDFCYGCDRSKLNESDKEILCCYLQTCIDLRIKALHALNSEKVTASREMVAQCFDELFAQVDRLWQMQIARNWVNAPA